jgi:hypothetical protein
VVQVVVVLLAPSVAVEWELHPVSCVGHKTSYQVAYHVTLGTPSVPALAQLQVVPSMLLQAHHPVAGSVGWAVSTSYSVASA